MEKELAEITIKTESYVGPNPILSERTWLIQAKHLKALTDFLDWAQKRAVKGAKRQKKR